MKFASAADFVKLQPLSKDIKAPEKPGIGAEI